MSEKTVAQPWASEKAPAAPAQAPAADPKVAEAAAAAKAAEAKATEEKAAEDNKVAKPTVATSPDKKTKVVLGGTQAPQALLNMLNSGMSMKDAKAKLGLK